MHAVMRQNGTTQFCINRYSPDLVGNRQRSLHLYLLVVLSIVLPAERIGFDYKPSYRCNNIYQELWPIHTR